MSTINGVSAMSASALLDEAENRPLLGLLGEPEEAVRVLDLCSVSTLGADQVHAIAQAIATGPRIVLGALADPAAGPVPAPLLEALDATWVSGRAEAAPIASSPTVLRDSGPVSLRAVLEGVAGNPWASLTLRQVLRTAEPLDVPAALTVESLAYSTLLGGREFAGWLSSRRESGRTSAERGPGERTDEVLVEIDRDVLRILLNRPERRNAYSAAMRDGLVEALRIAARNPDLRVELRGIGPVFCSGGDLTEFGTATDLLQAHVIRTAAGAASLAHAVRSRLTAVVHGACVGAGIEIPAFAGTVEAAEGTAFRLPEIAMGLLPGAGGATGIPRRIGRHRTLAWCLSGQQIDARTALSWGLVDRIFAP